jgi:hypothetical protein
MSKPKKCKVCRTEFKQFTTIDTWCSPDCAIELIKRNKEKKAKAEAKLIRKDCRERRIKLKSKSDWFREAQTAFNAYVRARDAGQACISCQKPPKKKNAGHYKSVGGHPELRFHPFNNNLQCEHCNTYKSGNQIEYRIHLIDKIGIDNVEWLEGPHEIQHLTIEDIQEIKGYYREQLKLISTT